LRGALKNVAIANGFSFWPHNVFDKG